MIGGGPSGLPPRTSSAAAATRSASTRLSASSAACCATASGRYRLPRAVLDGGSVVLALGIDVHAGMHSTRPEQFLRLREQYDAVYVAIGARRQRRLAQLDYVAPWVIDGAAYLAAAKRPVSARARQAVVAIGGGSAAMDRRAQRAARRPRSERVARAGGRDAGAARGGTRREGRRREVFDVEALVSPWIARSSCIPRTAWARTFQPRIRTASSLDDGAIFRRSADPGRSAESEARHQRLPRPRRRCRPAGASSATRSASAGRRRSDRRLANGQQTGARDGAGARAAQRHQLLLSAASRIVRSAHRGCPLLLVRALQLCDNCYQYCPDMAVRRVAGGYEIAFEYCKGCGLCVAECPTGSIAVQEDAMKGVLLTGNHAVAWRPASRGPKRAGVPSRRRRR